MIRRAVVIFCRLTSGARVSVHDGVTAMITDNRIVHLQLL